MDKIVHDRMVQALQMAKATAFTTVTLSTSTKKLATGETIEIAGEELALALPINLVNEDGTKTTLPDGEYQLEGDAATKFTIKDGVVSKIGDEAAKTDEAPATDVAASTDATVTAADAPATDTPATDAPATDAPATDAPAEKKAVTLEDLAVMVAALMERSFPWEIEKQNTNSDENKAVDTYIGTMLSKATEELSKENKELKAQLSKTPGAAPAGLNTTPKGVAPVTTTITMSEAIQKRLASIK